MLLQACQLGEDDEDDTVLTEYLTSDDNVGATISSNKTYELVVLADGNYVTLEDDIAKITITGASNTFIIDSDTAIDSISITGDSNRIEVESGVDLTITDLTILGNSNNVILFDITNTPTISADADGVDNIVCEANGATCI